jgi:hypothetical protein
MLAIICAALAACTLPALAQKIEIQKPDHNQIVRVKTALNHLTVIEVGEPVTTLAAGSPAFKIEWRENKVFVQPTEPNVNTNLFIWTASGRLNYELEPAGAVEQIDFAIDQPFPHPAPTPTTAVKPSSPAATEEFAFDALLGGKPIRLDGLKTPKNRVIVLLKDTFQLLPHIHRAGRLHQLRLLNPARPDISVLYNPFHCTDDDYMPVVNMVFGSFNLHDEFFAKHQLN